MAFGREFATGILIGATLWLSAPILWGWEDSKWYNLQLRAAAALALVCAVGLALEAVWLY